MSLEYDLDTSGGLMAVKQDSPLRKKVPKNKCPILFYGTPKTAVKTAKMLFPSENYKNKYVKKQNETFFDEGIQEIKNNPTVKPGTGQLKEDITSHKRKDDHKETKKSKKSKVEKEASANENEPPSDENLVPGLVVQQYTLCLPILPLVIDNTPTNREDMSKLLKKLLRFPTKVTKFLNQPSTLFHQPELSFAKSPTVIRVNMPNPRTSAQSVLLTIKSLSADAYSDVDAHMNSDKSEEDDSDKLGHIYRKPHNASSLGMHSQNFGQQCSVDTLSELVKIPKSAVVMPNYESLDPSFVASQFGTILSPFEFAAIAESNNTCQKMSQNSCSYSSPNQDSTSTDLSQSQKVTSQESMLLLQNEKKSKENVLSFVNYQTNQPCRMEDSMMSSKAAAEENVLNSFPPSHHSSFPSLQKLNSYSHQGSALGGPTSDPLSLDLSKMSNYQVSGQSTSQYDVPASSYGLQQGASVTTNRNVYPSQIAIGSSESDTDIMCVMNDITILRKDLITLKDENWLNDQVVNIYLKLIAERSKLKNPKVYPYSTYFYPSLKQNGIPRLLRWAKKPDIFSYDLVLLPLHLENHWALSVIDNRTKNINYYDSLRTAQTREIMHDIHAYITAAMRSRGITDKYQLQIIENLPKQKNGHDCGVFTLKYAEFVSRDAPITFTQEDIEKFRHQMVCEILFKQLM